MAKGKHPAPFRTRKLSPSAPMVLHAGACGRVGRRRTFFRRGPPASAALFAAFPGPDSVAPTCVLPKEYLMPAADDRSRGRRPVERAFREAGAARWPRQPTPRARRQARAAQPAAAATSAAVGKPRRPARRRQAGATSGTAARTAPAARPGAGGATTCPRRERTAVQAEYDGPPIPDDITGKELDPHVRPAEVAAGEARSPRRPAPGGRGAADGRPTPRRRTSTPWRPGPAQRGCRDRPRGERRGGLRRRQVQGSADRVQGRPPDERQRRCTCR